MQDDIQYSMTDVALLHNEIWKYTQTILMRVFQKKYPQIAAFMRLCYDQLIIRPANESVIFQFSESEKIALIADINAMQQYPSPPPTPMLQALSGKLQARLLQSPKISIQKQ